MFFPFGSIPWMKPAQGLQSHMINILGWSHTSTNTRMHQGNSALLHCKLMHAQHGFTLRKPWNLILFRRTYYIINKYWLFKIEFYWPYLISYFVSLQYHCKWKIDPSIYVYQQKTRDLVGSIPYNLVKASSSQLSGEPDRSGRPSNLPTVSW